MAWEVVLKVAWPKSIDYRGATWDYVKQKKGLGTYRNEDGAIKVTKETAQKNSSTKKLTGKQQMDINIYANELYTKALELEADEVLSITREDLPQGMDLFRLKDIMKKKTRKKSNRTNEGIIISMIDRYLSFELRNFQAGR